MNKHILPIYHTGWFYLLLMLWLTSYVLISNGGFNAVNQHNINMLYSNKDTASHMDNGEAFPKVLRLKAAFTESGVFEVMDVLSHYPDSSIALIGEPSEHFLKELKTQLVMNPRKHKVIVSSPEGLSTNVLNIQDKFFISGMLDWLRFSAVEQVAADNSRHLLFSPAAANPNKLLPLVWKNNDKHYLSAAGEILNQFSRNKEAVDTDALALVNYWQLYFSMKSNGVDEIWPLGFVGELFTPELLIIPSAIPLFIKEQGLDKFTFANKKNQFPIIVINDNSEYGRQTARQPVDLCSNL